MKDLNHQAPVTIRTTDGRSYNARVDIPRGDPALPLTDDELLSKYRDCARAQLWKTSAR